MRLNSKYASPLNFHYRRLVYVNVPYKNGITKKGLILKTKVFESCRKLIIGLHGESFYFAHLKWFTNGLKNGLQMV